MNRAIYRFIVVLFLAVTAGCNSGGDESLVPGKAPGVTDTEILIGSSLALGGHAGYLGTQTLHGASAYIRHINDSGGIYDRKIRVIAYDDEYDPPKCLFNTQNLIVSDKVFALFNYVGTPTTVKILPLVAEAKIPLVGMFTGASALREGGNPYLINVRASYYQETGAAVKHLVEKMKIRRVAVFYQYDAYGFDGLRGTEIALKRYGLLPVATGTYIRGTLNIEEGLEKIMASGAEAVVMIGTYDPCAKFIRRSIAKGFSATFYNVSFVGADELERKLGEDGEGLIVTQVVPPPIPSSTLWGVLEYLTHLSRYYPDDKPNFASLEGYINAKVLVEGLRRAGASLSRIKFIRALESIRNFDLGIANTLSFSHSDHQGFDKVYFTRIQNGRFVLIPE